MNDCPQYVQKTMLGYLPLKRVGQLGFTVTTMVLQIELRGIDNVVVDVVVVCQMSRGDQCHGLVCSS